MTNIKYKNYLFCYFTGNRPEEERIRFALSRDGIDFFPLNDNKPVIFQTLGTLSMRDPFIFRMQDGTFMIIATDMKSENGWNSNNSMVFWKSNDLINWYNESIIDFKQFAQTKNADRVWAPEVIYNNDRKQYMIYWSHHNIGDDVTSIWYIYTDDFKSFCDVPKELYRPSSGHDGIDADIIYKEGIYYLYYKDECEKTICLTTSKHMDGPYSQNIERVADTDSHVEGNCIYPLYGTNKHIMIMDKYTEGKYFMQITDDLINFKSYSNEDLTFNNLNSRHGSVILISDNEYEMLINKHMGKAY